MGMLLSATSTRFKWELMLCCLHCPTLNKVFLLFSYSYMNGLWIFITKTWSATPRNNGACVIKHGYDIRNRHIDSQSLVTDRLHPPLLSLSLYIKDFFLIGEESDGSHRIKRALYFGIKRLCIDSTKTRGPVVTLDACNVSRHDHKSIMVRTCVLLYGMRCHKPRVQYS